jgi:hypothetical protein
MTLEDIMNMWSNDCKIDATNISHESANIPQLHNRYYSLYAQVGLRLRKLKTDYKQLFKLKTDYYKGDLGPEELKEYGWEPQPLKILRGDLPIYLEADEDIILMTLKIGYQEEMLDFLESIIKQIQNRGFQLKSIVDWERFKAGG